MHILIGLILAFVVMALLSRRGTRGCRWRMDRSRNQDGQTFYKCMACGAEQFTEDAAPPLSCLKQAQKP